MSEKNRQVFKEEESKLKDIYKVIDACYKDVKEKINIYNNTKTPDINVYKVVDEADMKNAVRKSKKLKEVRTSK